MAEQQQLPNPNGATGADVRGLQAATEMGHQKISLSVTQSIGNLRNTFMQFSASSTAIASNQLKAQQQLIDQNAMYQQQIVDAAANQGSSMMDWLNTFLNFTNVQSNKLTAQNVDALIKLDSTTQIGNQITQELFSGMSTQFDQMNRKLADIAAHTMHALGFYERQEREKLANMEPRIEDDPTIGRPEIYEYAASIKKMQESQGITLKRQIAGEDDPTESSTEIKKYLQEVAELGRMFGRGEIGGVQAQEELAKLREQFEQGTLESSKAANDLNETIKQKNESDEQAAREKSKDEAVARKEDKREKRKEQQTRVTMLDVLNTHKQQNAKFSDWIKQKSKDFKEGEGKTGGLLSLLTGGAVTNLKGAAPWMAKGAAKFTWQMALWAARFVGNPAVAATLIGIAGTLWLADQVETVEQDPEKRKEQLKEKTEENVNEAVNAVTPLGELDRQSAINAKIQEALINKGYGSTEANLMVGTKAKDFDEFTGDNKYSADEVKLYEELRAKYEREIDKMILERKIEKGTESGNIPPKRLEEMQRDLDAINKQIESVDKKVNIQTKVPTDGSDVNGKSKAIQNAKDAFMNLGNNSGGGNVQNNVDNSVKQNTNFNVPKSTKPVNGTPAPEGLYSRYQYAL